MPRPRAHRAEPSSTAPVRRRGAPTSGCATGRIVAIADGRRRRMRRRTIDVDGRVVAPGFVDLHTHYDAQLFWDPTASPSPLHGVTTVLGGNCGFGLAPAGAEHVDYLARLMARVEGIPLAALEAGARLGLDVVRRLARPPRRSGIAVNAGFLAGHSPIRRRVMGDDAVGADGHRPRRSPRWPMLLRTCLAAGAIGLLDVARAHAPRRRRRTPCPRARPTDDELLASVRGGAASTPAPSSRPIVPGCINGFSDDEMDLLAAMSAAAERPLNWNVLGIGQPGLGHLRQLEASDGLEQVAAVWWR